MFEDETETYEFSVTIKQIKLSVKFPCKLTITHANRTIKSDLTADESGRYLIEREVKLKSENGQHVEILVNLTTEKGGNIMAGVIRLNPRDLSASEGSAMTMGLQKCLDQNASCLLKIERAWVTKTQKASSSVGEFGIRNKRNFLDEISAKKSHPAINDNYRNVETRSEYPGIDLKRLKGAQSGHQIDSYTFNNKRTHGLGPKSYVPEAQMVKSKAIDRSMEYRKQHKHHRLLEDDSKTVGKRQIDPSFRLTLEANEKNLKMDIMKYKMKSEEQQRTIDQKKKQIKSLKEQISELHRQSVEKTFYLEEINSKNSQIQKLDDNYKQAMKQNVNLRNKVIDLERAIEEAKSHLSSAVAKHNDEKQRKEMEYARELGLRKDDNSNLQDEIRSKNNQISRIKKIIEDLESTVESKTFDAERAIENQKAETHKLEALLNDKNRKLESMLGESKNTISELESELKKKTQELERAASSTQTLTVELKETKELQNYYASYKAKFSDLTKQYERLEEEKKNLEKHYEKLIQSKENDLGEFKNDQLEVLNQYKTRNAELTQKLKQSTEKNMELDNKVIYMNAQDEKLKRNIASMEKELAALTDAEKQLSQLNKSKDEKMLHLQREISDLQSKTSNRESLLKKELEYKQALLDKATQKLTEVEGHFRNEKQLNENLRFENSKIEGKNKLQEEILNRLNKQIEENKSLQEKWEGEFKEEIKELLGKIKAYEAMEKKFNKEISEFQINDLNRKNEISRLAKELQICSEKLERQKAKTKDSENANKEAQSVISEKNKELADVQEELKELLNTKKVLEADFTKTQKIKTIIIDEKTSAQQQMQGLRSEIEGKNKQLSQTGRQLKEVKQELTKTDLKLSGVTKQYEKFKQSICNSINSAFYQNKPTPKGFNLQSQSSSDLNRNRTASTIDLSLPGLMSPRRFHQSSVLLMTDRSDFYESKFPELIESYGKESQQTIMSLNDSIRKGRAEIERLQRQVSNLNSRLNAAQQQASAVIEKLNSDLQVAHKRASEEASSMQEKLMYSQRTNRQKEEMIEELNEEMEQLNHKISSDHRNSQIQIEESMLKIEQLKNRIYDLQSGADFSNRTILDYEQKVFGLEAQINQLNETIQQQDDKIKRKDKLLTEHSDKISELEKELNASRKQKSSLVEELAAVRSKLDSEREVNEKHRKMLQEEEQKAQEVKGFTNNLLKEKETVVKNEIQKAQKVVELEDQISSLQMRLSDLNLDLQQTEKEKEAQRVELKELSRKLTGSENALEEEKTAHAKSKDVIKQKQKVISEKELELKNVEISYQKLMAKYDSDISGVNSELEETATRLNREIQGKNNQIVQYQSEISKYQNIEKKISEDNLALEEQIFFEKQTNSLASSRFEAMKTETTQLQNKIVLCLKEIETLSEEVREREEKIFDLSGKIYTLEGKLEMKDIEMRERLEKLDVDWKNKYEETLEDYENKLQAYEREKNYFRQKLEEEMSDSQRIQNQKRTLQVEQETDKALYEEKLKKAQGEKLALLVQKNRQIEKIHSSIEQNEKKYQEMKHIKDAKQDALRKAEEKIREKEQKVSLVQERSNQSLKQLEKELEFQRKKESQIKKFKELVKNSLWSSEREVKKVIQGYVKNLTVLCEEEKKKQLMGVVRDLQAAVVKAMEVNMEEV